MKHSLIKAVLLLFIWGAFATAGALAQKAKVKSVLYKNYELPSSGKEEEEGGIQMMGFGDEEEEEFEEEEGGEPDTLLLTRRELKEYDTKGRMTKMELYLSNPIGQLVKNNITIKEWLDDVRTESISTFNEGGEPVMRTKSYYSKDDKLKLKEEFIDFVKNPDMEFTRTFEYNESGKPEKIVLTDKEGTKVGEETYKYNQDDEEIQYKKWELQADGSKYNETKKTTYTDEGFLESSEKIVKDGKDTYKDVIIFDRNKIKEQTKYKNGEQISSFGGKPAKAGEMRVMMEFGSGNGGGGFGEFGMLPEVEDEFDDKGRKIKTTETEGVEVTKLITYKYDDKSNLVETKEISYSEGEETGSAMEQLAYDGENNLVRKAKYNDGTLEHEELFDYEYYGQAKTPKPAEKDKAEKPKENKAETPKEDKGNSKATPEKKDTDKKTTPEAKSEAKPQVKIEEKKEDK